VVPVASAARNNAELCALVADTGTFAADAWTSPTRTPPLYADAVTLVPGVDPEALLARVETGPGCAVKDSYADLDLAPLGFHVLFDAQWICRPAGTSGGTSTLAVRELREINGEGWTARLNRSEDCVGLSNVDTAEPGLWAEVVAAVERTCPGVPIVGYERDEDLAAAVRHGFATIGPLRIWIR
jgi:hypothetical protein